MSEPLTPTTRPEPLTPAEWARGIIADTLRVQLEGCDHKGIGKPGCGTCDPRLYWWRDDLDRRFAAARADRAARVASEGLREAVEAYLAALDADLHRPGTPRDAARLRVSLLALRAALEGAET